MHAFLRNLIERFPHPTHPRFKELMRGLHAAGDAFGHAGPGDGSWGDRGAYQAIETFRQAPGYGFSAGDAGEAVRVFRSSGTTQGQRAAALFSQVGLDFYKLGSLIAFFSMIQRVFATEVPTAVVGISLVPPVTDWPDSSLAQMMAWIGTWAPVEYRVDAAEARGPCWVFGTAFHFVNLIDAGKARPLPQGAVIVETGGTKGRSREIGRAEFYAELARAFGVPRERIVSEYGMCELAAQAYDFGGAGFRFPFWVTPGVVTGPGTVARKGEGLLLVSDPLRVDHARSIRTEDLARVRLDSSFELLGRAPKAPLKGCSLLAEEITGPKIEEIKAGPTNLKAPDFSQGERIRKELLRFLDEVAVLVALAKDLGGEALARAALQDLNTSIPTSEQLWNQALHAAVGGAFVPKRWLFILPANHPIVGVYPVVMAQALGLDITVRIPKVFAGQGRFLARFVEAFGTKSVDATWRLEAARDVSAFDALLVYGDDDTVEKIRAASGGKPTVGFGTRAGLALVDGADNGLKVVKALARDAFGLAQSGCMSTRLAVVRWDKARDSAIKETAFARSFSEAVRQAGEEFLEGTPIPAIARIGQELEATRLGALGFEILAAKRPFTPLVAWHRDAAHALQALALRPYTLPIIFTDELPASLLAQSTIGTITASPHILDEISAQGGVKNSQVGKSFRPLGSANAPHWDGLHEGRALFQVN